MDKKTIEEILNKCNEEGTFVELFKQLDGCGFVVDGVSVSAKVSKGENGKIQAKIIYFGDINSMTLEDLEDYYYDLEEEYSELQDEEPDDPYSEEYDDWVDRISEMEDKIYAVEEKINTLKG